MKSISFNKTLCFTKSSIEIRYNGILPNDNVDLDKIEKLLEDFINNHRHDNMIENVTIVRTILNDCKEKLLVIFYQDDKGSELVKYVNSNLFLYDNLSNIIFIRGFDRAFICKLVSDFNKIKNTNMEEYCHTFYLNQLIIEFMGVYFTSNCWICTRKCWMNLDVTNWR